MKRIMTERYFWVDKSYSFVEAYNDYVLGGFNLPFLSEVFEPFSTYDYAVNLRSLHSPLLQELLNGTL